MNKKIKTFSYYSSALVLAVSLYVIYADDKSKPAYSQPANSETNIEQTAIQTPIIKTSQKLEPTVPNVPCTDLKRDQVNVRLDAIKEQKLQLLRTYIVYAKHNGFTQYQQETIVQQAGIPLITYRKLTALHGAVDINMLRPINGKPHIKTGKLRTDYYKYLMTEDYSAIVDLVLNGELTTQSIAGGKSILADVILHSHDNNSDLVIIIEIIQQLINAGLVPNFADLVTVTKASLPVPVLELLVSYTRDDIEQTWYHHHRKNNLTMLAAVNRNWPHYQFWQSQGVPAYTGENDYSAIDMLSGEVTTDQLAQAQKIFIDLASRSVKPYDVNTLKSIKQWLSPKIKQAHADYLAAHTQPQLSDLLADQSRKLSSLLRKYNTTEARLADCRQSYINTEQQVSGTNDVATSGTITENSMDEQEKQKIQNTTKHIAIALNYAIETGDWTNYLAEIENLVFQSDTFPQMMEFGLMQAISNNAPLNIINDFMDKGTTLLPNTIMMLAIRDNLDMAKNLQPHISFDAKDQENRNALYYAVEFNTSSQMIQYLLENGVEIEQDLLTPLLAKHDNNGVVNIIKSLLTYGHTVNESHRAAYKKLKHSNPSLFNALSGYF